MSCNCYTLDAVGCSFIDNFAHSMELLIAYLLQLRIVTVTNSHRSARERARVLRCTTQDLFGFGLDEMSNFKPK